MDYRVHDLQLHFHGLCPHGEEEVLDQHEDVHQEVVQTVKRWVEVVKNSELFLEKEQSDDPDQNFGRTPAESSGLSVSFLGGANLLAEE